MDIRALNQLTGANSGLAGAAGVPADTRALISEIAGSTALSDHEKTGLITAIATVDSGLTAGARSTGLEQIQRLGLYLRNSGSEGFPRWPMMTALRAYGMNLSEGATGQGAVISNLKGQLEQIAQGRGVSLERAIAAATSLPVQRVAPVVELDTHLSVGADDNGPALVEKIV